MTIFKKILDKLFPPPNLSRPIILLSAAVDEKNTGDKLYNGGVKLFNLWAKLLRSQGFLAYVVTYDGLYQSWMCDHQPHISIEIAKKWKKNRRNLRFITPWLASKPFIDLADKIYFHDCELLYSFGIHWHLLQKLIFSNKVILSVETRAEQARYHGAFNLDTHIVSPYCDPDYFFPDKTKRIKHRIGFVEEGEQTKSQIKTIKSILNKNKLSAHFVNIKGKEPEFISQLQACDIFLGMNPGKDKFGNEGLARTQLDAISCGAVPISFDVGGNHEFLFNEFNGYLIEPNNLKQMAKRLMYLLQNPRQKELLRKNAEIFNSGAFTPQRAWPNLKTFLNLNLYPDIPSKLSHVEKILNKQELALILNGPVYLEETEIPLLKQYSLSAPKTIVEIGAAYGASALLFLSHKKPTSKLYSIDIFTQEPDTKPPLGAPKPASFEQCKNNVNEALKILNLESRTKDWQLINNSSHNVAKNWRKKIDILFIDGDHSYKGVKQDFDDWFPFVKKNGVILLHDSRRLPNTPANKFNRGWQGPTKLARELKHNKKLKLINKVYSLTVWQKL